MLVVEFDDIRERTHPRGAFFQPRKIVIQTNLNVHSMLVDIKSKSK